MQQSAQEDFDALLMDQRMSHGCVVHMLLRDIKVGSRVGRLVSRRFIRAFVGRREVGDTVGTQDGACERYRAHHTSFCDQTLLLRSTPTPSDAGAQRPRGEVPDRVLCHPWAHLQVRESVGEAKRDANTELYSLCKWW